MYQHALFDASLVGSIDAESRMPSYKIFPEFLDSDLGSVLFRELFESKHWKQPSIFMYGRRVLTPRLTWWMGDPCALYSYSGIYNEPTPWTETVKELGVRLQDLLGHKFNSVLLNLYRDGSDHMSWHSDNEPELGGMPVIASISLGATRLFKFRRKNRDANEKSITIPLTHGTLLVMQGLTQQEWEHSIPKEARVTRARINLTYRLINR